MRQVFREFVCRWIGHRWGRELCGVDLGIPTFCKRCGCPAWRSLKGL